MREELGDRWPQVHVDVHLVRRAYHEVNGCAAYFGKWRQRDDSRYGDSVRVHTVANVRRVPQWGSRGSSVILCACLVVQGDEERCGFALLERIVRRRPLLGGDRRAFGLRVTIVHVRNQHFEREQPEAQKKDGGDATLEQVRWCAERGRGTGLSRARPIAQTCPRFIVRMNTHSCKDQMPPRETMSSISAPRYQPDAARLVSPSGATTSADDQADLCEVRCIDAPKVESARRAMKEAAMVERAADTFKVLGDPTRLRIVHALAREELCVCDLALLLEQSQSTVSHSLRSLRQMRLVRYRKVGKIAYYSLDDEHIARLVGVAFEHAEEHR